MRSQRGVDSQRDNRLVEQTSDPSCASLPSNQLPVYQIQRRRRDEN
jgi:hypothetical protein